MSEKVKTFARLETINGAQILAQIEMANEGLQICVRMDRDASVQICGPFYDDDDDGWAAARHRLLNLDFAEVALQLENLLSPFASGDRAFFVEEGDQE